MDAPLKLKLQDDLKQALKGGDKMKANTLRLLLASIKNTEIARHPVPKTNPDKDPEGFNRELAEIASHPVFLTDADIHTVVAKEIRQRQESIEAFKKGNRADLVAQEEAELAVLTGYMPKQMGREEITAEARKVIAEVGAKGPADKGKVMPKIMAQLKGKADGREINAIVTELLSS